MLDLYPGIHFDKIKFIVFIQKFEGTRTFIPHLYTGIGTSLADLLALLGCYTRSWRLLDHFLMFALHRTITFSEVDGVTVRIGQHLDFYMPGRSKEFFHVYDIVIECGAGFRLCHLNRVQQAAFCPYYPHTASATAARRFNNNRVANFASEFEICFLVIG